ncbi:MAG: nitroreductase family protein [Lactobacillaceae bacterium]|jgi:predicted oxidoreductase (fatty acid repression mutant protein)|nr:nitroreductase family protein [Lactobacillaceae bacterium]
MLEKIIEKRRSIYNLGKKETLAPEKVVKLVEHCAKHCPTAFNSQSSRVVVLFNKHHEKLWNIALDTIKKIIPAEAFVKTEQKVNSCFKSGYGTILYFEEDNTTKNLQEKFPLYKDNFPIWAEQASGMLQNLIWISLAEKDVGASLQHYNPLINGMVKKEWNIPESWRLIAQMPFGSIEAPADKKDFIPIKERVKIYK